MRKIEGLQVKVPTFFRCPISLEVMRSPVSLCTGVTYDRDSIQRWLDSGNTTCPATNVPLPTTDLVPNLTLRRLINLWSLPSSTTAAGDLTWQSLAADLQRDPSSLRRILDFLRDPDRDEFEKHRLVSSPPFAASLASALLKDGEACLAVLDLVLAADFVDRGSRTSAISAVASDLPGSAAAIAAALGGSGSETRIHAARVLEAILSFDSCDEGSKAKIAEDRDLVAGLIRMIGPAAAEETEAAIACLVVFSEFRRSRPLMVSLGVVPAAAGVLSSSPEVAERAIRLVESASTCAEGREAICAAAGEVLGALVARMNKAGTQGAEAASAVLWRVCHRHRDPRAVAAVAAVPGGLAKILLVMQSVCSPAARQMAGDLLKIFRVNSKSCLHRYDTNTTHIMPF